MRPDTKVNVEELSQEECWRLLSGRQVGRVAVMRQFYPLILPVNYALDGHDVVFVSGEGVKHDVAGGHHLTSFEVDEIDVTAHTGWDVLVRGTLENIEDVTDLGRATTLPLTPWAGGDKPYHLRVRAHAITGRRLHQVSAPS